MSGSSTPPRPEGRRVRRFLRPWHWVALAVAGAVLPAALLLSASPAFRASHLRVEGNVHRTDRQILALAGLSSRTNVLWLDREAAERRLERDPWIERSTVERSLPSTLTVEVVERTPVAVVLVPGVPRLLVAGDGVVLGPRTGASRGGPAAVIDGVGALPAGPGSATAPAGRILGAMASEVRNRVERVTVGEDGEVELRLTSGTVVLYGPIRDEGRKSAAIAGILRWAARSGRELAEIDVRSPESPTARPGTPEG